MKSTIELTRAMLGEIVVQHFKDRGLDVKEVLFKVEERTVGHQLNEHQEHVFTGADVIHEVDL